jgi:hypothetical protein
LLRYSMTVVSPRIGQVLAAGCRSAEEKENQFISILT